ncbi:hypothetical protein K469DRAFT_682582 [Zopfia rhizophila CBS 207.26]|uniref:Uncharacterized protein n=1 Tax=Zopfia rhizophila CBS 207.26 TaxID=1314779 RepID=A0A6A6DBK8_9PEZI|nr:hypothetical protein K469DRAFT_682582 [Zopfia rhizophila CBS 207.26]
MNAEHNHDHSGNCIGHCRAQRFAMDSHCVEQFEKEKAAIKSYEDGWDRWDGPIWPWRQTNDPQSQMKMENEWQGCCNTPSERVEQLTKVVSKKSVEPPRPTKPIGSVKWASPISSLWSARTNPLCPNCGMIGSSSCL